MLSTMHSRPFSTRADIFAQGLTSIAAAGCLLLGTSGCATQGNERVEIVTAQRLDVWESPDAKYTVRGAETTHLDLTLKPQAPGRWEYESLPDSDDPRRAFPGSEQFDRLLLSWNLLVEANAGAIVEIRVWPTRSGGWSPYLQVGTVGTADGRRPVVRAFDDGGRPGGEIQIDQFVSSRSYRAFSVRVTAIGEGITPPARIERLAIWRGDSQSKLSISVSELAAGTGPVRVDLPVPFHSQRTPVPHLAGRLCSPTSVDMVLAYAGLDVDLLHLAERVRDPDFDIYGNWPRNVQAAFEFGLPGYLTRFNDWNSVAALLETGQPIVASIAAPKGVLTNAPYQALDDGHLIVLRGLDGQGGVYVNDPAAGDARNGQRVYPVRELTKAWLQLGDGTAYVLGRKVDTGQGGSEGNR